MPSGQIDSQVIDASSCLFAVGGGDPDRPFPFADYVAIASSIRHRGRCEVWVDHSVGPAGTIRLPYGMWWQELRPLIELRFGSPAGEPETVLGVWAAADLWLDRHHVDYESVAATYRRATWLDESVA